MPLAGVKHSSRVNGSEPPYFSNLTDLDTHWVDARAKEWDNVPKYIPDARDRRRPGHGRLLVIYSDQLLLS
jgi:hypothetical protein